MPSTRSNHVYRYCWIALMRQDENKAFELLDKNRKIQKLIIEQSNGKWIKDLGYGVIASFIIVADASLSVYFFHECVAKMSSLRLFSSFPFLKVSLFLLQFRYYFLDYIMMHNL